MRELARNITEWLVNHGYDPLVMCGIAGLVFLILDQRSIRNLKSLEPHWRRFTIAGVVACVMLVFIGLLSALGLLPNR